MAYQLTRDPDTLIRLSDGATVPKGHRFWLDYEKWLAVGGKPEPAFVIDPAVSERAWRDAEFERVKWLRERHRDETEVAQKNTLTEDQYSELLAYIQELRDWPQSESFPNTEHRPVAPPWIADQTPSRR